MTTARKCSDDKINQCDAKYVLKVWLYRTTAVLTLASVGSVIAAVSWKKDIEYRIDRLETNSAKIDSMYNWMRDGR